MSGIDPAELRRRNFVPRVRHAVQDRRRHHLRQRRFRTDARWRVGARRLRAASKRAGAKQKSAANIAASASPACSSMPAARRSRARFCSFPGDGTLMVNLNVQSTGQGHATVFLPLVADRLGIPREQGRSSARRFRARDRRLCLGRLALGHDRGRRCRQMHRDNAG